jgi:hypothetical protein
MGSRHRPDDGAPRPPSLSRRTVLVGAAATPAVSAAAPLVTASPAPADPTKPYKTLLYLDAAISRLRRRWARLDAYLSDQLESLPAGAEPKPLRGAQELRDIDGMIELLLERRTALLEKLPSKGAATLEELIARLAVAERLIWNDDHLEAQALIAGTRQDLASLLEHGRLPGR